ncbi:MAG: hypothetical protein EBV03_09140 [Proteobacteria bacterium]|nr:hypothetical protein [Pseudomonadota bacterium]
MPVLLSACARAFASLFNASLIAVLVASIGVTLAVLTGFVFVVGALCVWLAGSVQGHETFSALAPWLGSIGAGAIAWLLFPGITPVIISFFDARITKTIEEKHYPGLLQRPAPPFWPELWHDTRFALKALALNIASLPLYLLPGLNLILFYWLNGYLLGREYFVMVARRHVSLEEANALRKRHSGVITWGGALVALMTTVPILNLGAPFWGVALMVHLYQKLQPSPQLLAPLPQA